MTADPRPDAQTDRLAALGAQHVQCPCGDRHPHCARCGALHQGWPCDARALADALRGWETLAAEKNWGYVRDERYDALAVRALKAEQESEQRLRDAIAWKEHARALADALGRQETVVQSARILARGAEREPYYEAEWRRLDNALAALDTQEATP